MPFDPNRKPDQIPCHDCGRVFSSKYAKKTHVCKPRENYRNHISAIDDESLAVCA